MIGLPKLQLRRFGGDVLKFADYGGKLKNNVHQRTDISDTNTFTFLLGQLDGGAARVLAGLSQMQENYKRQSTSSISVSIISARSFAFTHSYTLPNISSLANIAGLRELIDEMGVHVTNLHQRSR